MNIAVLYNTSKNNQKLFSYIQLSKYVNEFNLIHSDVKLDLFIYVNNEELDKDVIRINNYYEYSYKLLQDKYNYKHSFGKQLYVGNVFLTVIDLFSNYQYDKILFYEDDAYIKKNIFNSIDFISYDVIFQSKRKANYNWDWYINKNVHNLTLTPYEGLLNIYALSNTLIKDIYDFMLDGNYAHHEYIINSFVMNNQNIKIGYLNDYFSISEVCNINHINYACDILHPIKNSEQIYKKV